MRTQPLILGIACACVALAVTAVITQRRTARAAPDVPAPEPAAGPAPEEPMMGASLAFPGGALPETGAAMVPTPSSPREQVAPPAGPSATKIFEELQEARELGLISDRRMAEFLARIYLENGQGRRALRLLELHGSADPEAWVAVAQALEQAGDVAGQREALLAALELDPYDNGLLDALGRIEPGLVVSQLSRLLAAEPAPGNGHLRARLAGAMLRNGQGAEARALIEGLLLENPGDEQAIMLLSSLDPGRAIAYVEGQMALTSEPGELRILLVNLLTDSGNVAGAEAVLERLAREGQAVSAEEWGGIAQFWLDSNEQARGVRALQRALVHEHGDPDEWVHHLAALAPAELMLALERRVASDEAHNDEYWGSLADSYWNADRRAEARAAWERARALDPDDGEWPGRLRALDQGRDPFGD